MLIDEGIQHLVGVGEHAVGEEEGGGIAWTGGTGDQHGEQRGNGVAILDCLDAVCMGVRVPSTWKDVIIT